MNISMLTHMKFISWKWSFFKWNTPTCSINQLRGQLGVQDAQFGFRQEAKTNISKQKESNLAMWFQGHIDFTLHLSAFHKFCKDFIQKVELRNNMGLFLWVRNGHYLLLEIIRKQWDIIVDVLLLHRIIHNNSKILSGLVHYNLYSMYRKGNNPILFYLT